MGEFTRDIQFLAAWDRRAEGGGSHGVTIRFTLKGEQGGVTFTIYTNWFLWQSDDWYFQEPVVGVIPADLGYHSRMPTEYGMYTEDCDVTGGPCWYDGSGLGAHRLFVVLTREGHGGVWREMERYYKETFNV